MDKRMQESVCAGLCPAGVTDQGCSPCASSTLTFPLFFHTQNASSLPKSFIKSLGLLPVLLTQGTSFRPLDSVWSMLGEKKHF